MCFCYRLIKGDGEVLEEIVTKERHKEINKVDGFYSEETFWNQQGPKLGL